MTLNTAIAVGHVNPVTTITYGTPGGQVGNARPMAIQLTRLGMNYAIQTYLTLSTDIGILSKEAGGVGTVIGASGVASIVVRTDTNGVFDLKCDLNAAGPGAMVITAGDAPTGSVPLDASQSKSVAIA